MNQSIITELTFPEYCPKGDGAPDCENCVDWDGEICTYP